MPLSHSAKMKLARIVDISLPLLPLQKSCNATHFTICSIKREIWYVWVIKFRSLHFFHIFLVGCFLFGWYATPYHSSFFNSNSKSDSARKYGVYICNCLSLSLSVSILCLCLFHRTPTDDQSHPLTHPHPHTRGLPLSRPHVTSLRRQGDLCLLISRLFKSPLISLWLMGRRGVGNKPRVGKGG